MFNVHMFKAMLAHLLAWNSIIYIHLTLLMVHLSIKLCYIWISVSGMHSIFTDLQLNLFVTRFSLVQVLWNHLWKICQNESRNVNKIINLLFFVGKSCKKEKMYEYLPQSQPTHSVVCLAAAAWPASTGGSQDSQMPHSTYSNLSSFTERRELAIKLWH